MNSFNKQEHDDLSLEQTTLIDECARALYKGTPVSVSVSLILALTLSIANWNIIGHGDLIVWNILMFCAAAIRIASWFFWRNTRTTISAQYWLNNFRLGAWIAGAVWGSSVYFMFAAFNPTYQALLAFTLAGVASGSLATLAIDKLSVAGFVFLTTFPLSIRLHMDDGPIALPMSIMTIMFIIFVLAASARARRQQEDTFYKNARLIEWGNERIQQQLLSKIIENAQTLFISDKENTKTFDQLLNDVISITDSKIGFIGEIFHTEEQKPYLNMLAMTNIAWDEKSQRNYHAMHNHGSTMANLETLFGAALTSGHAIISNNPAADMRAGGTPAGHTPMSAYLGIPIFHQAEMVAMLSLANKNNGYRESDADFLKPITDLIAQFVVALRHQRKHQENAEHIKRQSIHTKAILDEAFDAIITTDQYGAITSFNHAAEIIFGYRTHQIIGKNINTLMPEPYRSEHEEYLKTHQATGIKKIIGVGRELKGLRRNGKEFPMEIAISEITENDETTYISMIRDISERQNNEQIKHEFIATISYELRTPLTSISAALAIIESGKLGPVPEKISPLIKIAKQNSTQLQHLIVDILDMDRLLSNDLELNLQDCNAPDIIQNAIVVNQYLADKYHIKYQVTNIDLTARVFADENRTQQVLGHLLINAAKFSSPYSNVDITLTVKKHWVRFSVTDYGIGISDEKKANIFKTFSAADKSNSSNTSGSGFGLAISKQLIEKMGGKIGFTSSVGQGSSFYFDLPLAKN